MNGGGRWTGGAEGIKEAGIKGPREGQQWARDLDESQGAVQAEREEHGDVREGKLGEPRWEEQQRNRRQNG